MKTSFIVFSALIFLMEASFLSAQDNFVLQIADDSCEVVRTLYLGAYPPVLSSMPWYIANSYAATDSVSRTAELASIEDSVRNLPDNLLRLGYYHYLETVAYNPILEHHYWWSSWYGDDYTYITRPRLTIATMLAEYYRRFGEPDTNQQKIFDADGGIYEIYVESLNKRQDAGDYGLNVPNVATYFHCVTGIIETAHFGKVTNFPDVVLDGVNYQTIQISWGLAMDPMHKFIADPAEYLSQGRRYLVFAEAFKVRKFGTICEWRIQPGIIFLIGDDGLILDPLRFFGSSSVISIAEARGILQSWISSLYN
jgi:hypothetical protein